MTLIFYDWEFDAETNPEVIEPISLGAVTDDGQEFYAINRDFHWDSCKSEWLKENVQSQLILPDIAYLELSKDNFKRYLMGWLASSFESLPAGERLKLVGYYADYDHVCLSQRFGTMMQLPPSMPMWTRDLKQWCDDLGNPELPEQGKGEHHALLDARWVRDSYNWLTKNYDHPAWTPRLRKPRLKPSDCF